MKIDGLLVWDHCDHSIKDTVTPFVYREQLAKLIKKYRLRGVPMPEKKNPEDLLTTDVANFLAKKSKFPAYSFHFDSKSLAITVRRVGKSYEESARVIVGASGKLEIRHPVKKELEKEEVVLQWVLDTLTERLNYLTFSEFDDWLVSVFLYVLFSTNIMDRRSYYYGSTDFAYIPSRTAATALKFFSMLKEMKYQANYFGVAFDADARKSMAGLVTAALYKEAHELLMTREPGDLTKDKMAATIRRIEVMTECLKIENSDLAKISKALSVLL